jgi:hypothetical protein
VKEHDRDHDEPRIVDERGGDDPGRRRARLPSDRTRGLAERDDGRLARIIDRARLLGDGPAKELPADQQSERRILPGASG